MLYYISFRSVIVLLYCYNHNTEKIDCVVLYYMYIVNRTNI